MSMSPSNILLLTQHWPYWYQPFFFFFFSLSAFKAHGICLIWNLGNNLDCTSKYVRYRLISKFLHNDTKAKIQRFQNQLCCCVCQKLEGSSKRIRQIHLHQRSKDWNMCILIKILSKVENSICIFIGFRIRKGIKQYECLYSKGTATAKEATEWKRENLGWKVRNSWWGKLLEKGLFSLKKIMEMFRMFKNTLDRTL